MLDIEFLTERPAFPGTVIYRYRSGILRPAMLAFVEELSARSGGVQSSYSCDELAARWSDENAFWSGIRVCDLPEPSVAAHQFKLLKPLLATKPGEPTLILMRASGYNDGQHPGALVVDEPLVTTLNISKLLKRWARHSDLPGATAICDEISVQRYFKQWIDIEGKASLPDLIEQFERAILLYTEPGRTAFAPPALSEQDPTSRALVVSGLAKYLRDQNIEARAGLLQALSIKVQRGWSDEAIWDDLAVASRKVLSKVAKAESQAAGYGQVSATTRETAILWCVLVLVRCKEISQTTGHSESIPITLAIEHVCLDFEARIDRLVDDPLDGIWSELPGINVEQQKNAEPELVSEPADGLCRIVAIETAKCRSTNWPVKLHRVLSASKPAMTTSILLHGTNQRRELWSFNELTGQKHVVAGIRQRFEQDSHRRPLILSGPPGAGKQTVATLYARALLCEGRQPSSIDPCHVCPTCREFSREGDFGYAEFDFSNAEVVRQSFEKLHEFCFRGFSSRRAVVLRNTDHKDGILDLFLKTMEEKNTISTYIVLAREERHVRAAMLSRGARFRLRRITDDEARCLVNKWLPAEAASDEMVHLINLHGDYRPGLMWHLSRLLLKYGANTLSAAKTIFNLEWGDRVVDYFQAFLTGNQRSANRLLQEIDADPLRAVAHLRKFIAYMLRDAASDDAAFLGEAVSMQLVRCAAYDAAEKLGMDSRRLWCVLANHWLEDVVVDFESLADAGKEAELVLNGFR